MSIDAIQKQENFYGDNLSVNMFTGLAIIGRGEVDASSAINDAIAYVGSLGGGSVAIPPGTYMIQNDIVVNYDNVFIRGFGKGTVIRAGANNLKLIHWCGSRGGINGGLVLDASQPYSDLVIDAVTSTQCTSAARPFTSANVGSFLMITSGAGFDVQTVKITSVILGVATCNFALGAVGSTGGTGSVIFSGVSGLRVSPLIESSTSTQVSQDFNIFHGIKSIWCDDGLVLMCGPTVGGADSGCYYNSFYSYEALNCKRGIWLANSASSGVSGSNRNQWYSTRIGQAGPLQGGLGSNTGVQIDSGGTNKFFGCSFEGIQSQAFTDLVIGSSDTQCTSAAQPFNATNVGMTLTISGGTGFIVQQVTITSVSAGNVATCSASLGAPTSTGGIGTISSGPNDISTAILIERATALGGDNNDNNFYGTTIEACDRHLDCRNPFTEFYGGGPIGGTQSVFSSFGARVIYGGSGYVSGATVSVSGGGSVLGKVLPTFTVHVTAGIVDGITQTSLGQLMTEPPLLSIVPVAGGTGALAMCRLAFPAVSIGGDPSSFPQSQPGMIYPEGNFGTAGPTIQNMWNLTKGLFFPIQAADQLLIGGKLSSPNGTGLGQMATFKPPLDNWGYPALFLTDGSGRGPLVADQNFDVGLLTGKGLFLNPDEIIATDNGAFSSGPFSISCNPLKIGYLNASQPVLTDAFKNLKSGNIDMANAVTGILGCGNGGTGGSYANLAALAAAILSLLTSAQVIAALGYTPATAGSSTGPATSGTAHTHTQS